MLKKKKKNREQVKDLMMHRNRTCNSAKWILIKW